MAARENQGYLIAVIILVLLSLVLALVAFLGVQGAYEQADTAKSFEQKAYVAQKQAEAESFKAEAYAAMIGSLGTAPAELAQAKQDLKPKKNPSIGSSKTFPKRKKYSKLTPRALSQSPPKEPMAKRPCEAESRT